MHTWLVVIAIIIIVLYLWVELTPKEKKLTRTGMARSDHASILQAAGGDIFEAEFIRQEAIELFNKALEINSSYADAYLGRGNCYFRIYAIGKDEVFFIKADDDFNKALSLNPRDEYIYAAKGSLYSSKGLHQNAIAFFKQSLEINPHNKHTKAGLELAKMNI